MTAAAARPTSAPSLPVTGPVPAVRQAHGPACLRQLPARTRAALIERAAMHCAAQGLRRVVLYPAGRHTRAMDPAVWARCGVEIVAVVDDLAAGEALGRPIVPPTALPADAQAVVVSTDTYEAAMAHAAAGFAGGRPVVRIYEPDMAGLDDAADRRAEARRLRPPTPSDEIERLRATFTGRLNLGCGDQPLDGWTNVDGGDGDWYDAPPDERVIALDAFLAMAALPSGSADYVYSEHFFEHFTVDEGRRLLAEWRRILKPGGVVRLVTPDLEREARLYLGLDEPATDEAIQAHRRGWLGTRYRFLPGETLTRGTVLNQGMRLDGHKFVYDEQTARQAFELAGFAGVRRCRFGESPVEALRGIDRHDGGPTGREWIPGMALILEAVRP